MIRTVAALVLWLGVLGGAAADTHYEPHATIRQAARTFLLARASEEHRGKTVVEVGALDPRLRLPACSAPLSAFLPPGGRTLGATAVGVRCQGARPWTLYVPARVRAMGPVVVAGRALGRGERLRADDLQVVERDLAEAPPGHLEALDEAVGMTLRRPLAAGTPLTRQALAPPLVVRRGQQVVLLAEGAGLQVRSTGQALADAARGERVRVKNSRSQRIVEGVAVGAATVKVDL